MSSTRLVLVRHGNTFGPGDVVTRVGARTNLPLAASGVAQAQRLGAYLQHHALVPTSVFTSRLLRTQQTAAVIFETLGLSLPTEARSLFDEIDYGPDENQPEERVRARLGAAVLEAWEARSVVPPGWHVDPEALCAGWRAFADEVLATRRGATTLVVTSGGILRFAPTLVGNLEGFLQEHKAKVATGGLCLFEASAGGGWRCLHWNLRP